MSHISPMSPLLVCDKGQKNQIESHIGKILSEP